jgi:hypothetical protein
MALVATSVLWLCVWVSARPGHAAAATTTPVFTGTPNTTAQITFPTDSAQLFGVVRITGTASNAAMQQYRLDFLAQADPRAQWQPIASGVAQQVTNGTLGQWDTTKVADGVYQLRLRVTLRNGTVYDEIARNLTVSNQQPTPLPTIPPPATATSLPTAGPSPSPIIQQPATATPNVVGPVIVQPTNVPPTADTSTVPNSGTVTLSFAAMEGAACSGGLIAVIAFAIGGSYVVIRSRLRRAGR